ncbi:hypothetical protein RKD37_006037 [Streptomyces ambofaciens]
MSDLIPAAPGWYLEGRDEDGRWLEPIIAWTPGIDLNGDDSLFPYVPGGPGGTPLLIDAQSFKDFSRDVLYRPNHDPAND